jgi:hypothetical protein
MVTLTITHNLRDTEDFVVEFAGGAVGRVEEIWLGPEGEPQAVAVRTKDGDRALLLAEDVLAVDRERRWVVCRPEADLLELEAPLLASRDDDGHVAASWSTTGALLHDYRHTPAPRIRNHRLTTDRPLWQVIAILYAGVGFVVVFVVALVFLIARLVAGSAY